MSEFNYHKNIWENFSSYKSSSDELPVKVGDKFESYSDRIREVLKFGGCTKYSKYDSELIDYCNLHIQKYNKPLEKKEVIVLVHPFYMGLRHMYHLNVFNSKSVKIYMDNLERIFSENKSRDIIIFDTAHSYAAIDSEILEKGIIKDSVLTGIHNGIVEYKNDLSKLEGKSIFIGGGYNKMCLSEGINQIKKVAKDISWIEGVTMNSPFGLDNNLLSKKIPSLNNSITIDSLLKD